MGILLRTGFCERHLLPKYTLLLRETFNEIHACSFLFLACTFFTIEESFFLPVISRQRNYKLVKK